MLRTSLYRFGSVGIAAKCYAQPKQESEIAVTRQRSWFERVIEKRVIEMEAYEESGDGGDGSWDGGGSVAAILQ